MSEENSGCVLKGYPRSPHHIVDVGTGMLACDSGEAGCQTNGIAGHPGDCCGPPGNDEMLPPRRIGDAKRSSAFHSNWRRLCMQRAGVFGEMLRSIDVELHRPR
jgi:hypothetical protein